MERDFFISRAGADKELAIHIAAIIRRAGFTTWLQDEDFGHASFMARMAEGFSGGARMIALLSRHYQQSDYCKAEYEHVLSDDPLNKRERLIVLRIEQISPIEHLKNLAYTDLVPVLNDATALERSVRVAIDLESQSSELPLFQPATQIIHPEVSAVDGFMGREQDLKAIDTMFFGQTDLSTNTTAIIDKESERTTLQGLGGVGKSLLAKQYTWLQRDRFAGIWWIRAESPETLDEDLLLLGSRFITGIENHPERELAVQTVLAELVRQSATGTEKPWCLIYDNVVQPRDLSRRLPQQGVKVLITSRWTDWYPHAAELPVDTFPPEVAIEYLLARARNEQKNTAAALARDLGYLPLALDHARTYCWQSRCSFSDYQDRLNDLIKKAPANALYPATLYATFSLAIEKAIDECEEAESILGTLSLFEPDAIPFDLVSELCDGQDETDAVVSALTNVSLLINVPTEDGANVFSQHRLVQAVARSRIADNDTVYSSALSALVSLWPTGNEGSHPDNWPLCQSLLPHATALLNHVQTPSPDDESIALLAGFVGIYLDRRGDHKSAEKWELTSLEIRQQVLGEEHPSTAASYNNVASNLDDQGRYEEAEPLYRKAVKLVEKLLGYEHPNSKIMRQNLEIFLKNRSS